MPLPKKAPIEFLETLDCLAVRVVRALTTTLLQDLIGARYGFLGNLRQLPLQRRQRLQLPQGSCFAGSGSMAWERLHFFSLATAAIAFSALYRHMPRPSRELWTAVPGPIELFRPTNSIESRCNTNKNPLGCGPFCRLRFRERYQGNAGNRGSQWAAGC